MFAMLPALCWADSRGAGRESESEVAGSPGIYSASYALLIGVSEYSYWQDLPSIPDELDVLDRELTRQGFQVERLRNPDRDQLSDGVSKFIDRYGYNSDHRLLIFFSGHGHTIRDNGYLVPANAPLPSAAQSFGRSALSMEQVISWAKIIESKHVLFAFDSCFSGSIFKTRSMPTEPNPYVRQIASRPVRQFLTSGSADEEVPAKSTFAPMFVGGISGKGDLNGDGYVTGSELGLYITQELPRYEPMQTPQYGKINNYELSQGDFVFGPVSSVNVRPDISLGPTVQPEITHKPPRSREQISVSPSEAVSPMAVFEKMGIAVSRLSTNDDFDFYQIEEKRDRRNSQLKPKYMLRMSKATDWSSSRISLEYARDKRSAYRTIDCVLKFGRYYDCD